MINIYLINLQKFPNSSLNNKNDNRYVKYKSIYPIQDHPDNHCRNDVKIDCERDKCTSLDTCPMYALMKKCDSRCRHHCRQEMCPNIKYCERYKSLWNKWYTLNPLKWVVSNGKKKRNWSTFQRKTQDLNIMQPT